MAFVVEWRAGKGGVWAFGVALLAAVLALSLPAAPAVAQSFFQTLFGFGKPAAKSPPARAPHAAGPRLRPGTFQSYRSFTSPRGDDGTPYQTYRGPGNYRLMCVRLCDGYYFPFGTASSPGDMADAEYACKSTCAGDAQIYYLPRGSSDIKAMSALDGSRYDKLKNAFVYRQTLVSGCGCRPAPWSIAERFRHDQYAAEEAGRRAKEAFLRAEAEADARRKDAIARVLTENKSEPTPVVAAAAAPVVQTASVAHMLPTATIPKRALQAELAAIGMTEITAVAVPTEAVASVTLSETDSSATADLTVAREPGTRLVRTKSSSGGKRKKSQSGASSFFGSGTASYTWPGDAPRRSKR